MSIRPLPIALVVVVAGAAVVAATRTPDAPPRAAPVARQPDTAPFGADDPRGDLPPDHPPIGAAGGPNGDLPPDHPPIGAAGGPNGDLPPDHPPASASGGGAPAADDDASIAWKVPDAWKTVPNPSSMRLATYRVPSAKGSDEPVDVSVTRAGGSTDANVQRWVGQFSEASPEKRTEKKVHGIKVTVVEIAGTFAGGGMMGGANAGPRAGWALLGAVVEAPGTPYFFKMTGPAATVAAARPAFDALVASIAPR